MFGILLNFVEVFQIYINAINAIYLHNVLIRNSSEDIYGVDLRLS